MPKNVAKYGWIIVLLLTGPVYGDTVFGIYAGAGSWQQGFSGDITSGITQIDIEDDLALEDENNNIFYLALEHGVPVLPNLRLQHAKIAVSGNNDLIRTIEFNGSVFDVADTVATNMELNQTDLVLYYEVLDNVISLDIGVAVRPIAVLPLLYAKVRADLPLTGLWVGAEVQGLGYNTSSLVDANAQIGWESRIGLGVEGGWRTYRLDLEDLDDFNNVSLDISGPYFALNFHF